MMRPLLKWNMEAFDEIRTCPALVELAREKAEELEARANQYATTSGAKYSIGAEGVIGRKRRYRISVHTENYRARLDNQKHNTLLKAVGGE